MKRPDVVGEKPPVTAASKMLAREVRITLARNLMRHEMLTNPNYDEDAYSGVQWRGNTLENVTVAPSRVYTRRRGHRFARAFRFIKRTAPALDEAIRTDPDQRVAEAMRRAERFLDDNTSVCHPELLSHLRICAALRPRTDALPAYLLDKARAWFREHRVELEWTTARFEREVSIAIQRALSTGAIDRHYSAWLDAHFARVDISRIQVFNAAMSGEACAPPTFLSRVYQFFGLENAALQERISRARKVLPALK